MNRLFLRSARHLARGVAAAACAGALGSAQAALAVGAAAPDFSADAAVGGQVFRFRLAQALRDGPVVLYFYPKSFTSGCTVEAHEFSQATPRFKALGATVIGVSHDDLATQKRFSVEACRGQFAVAADDDARVIKAYDAGLMLAPSVADRISYVISPQGRVLLAYASLSPDGHVAAALQAVQQWRQQAGAPAVKP
jgi:thioredoxin-dependent peroxiredoxin